MNLGAGDLADRRFRAPSEDRSVLLEPSFAETGSLLAANGNSLSGKLTPSGRSLDALRALGREELLSAAVEYTRSYRDLSPRWNQRPGASPLASPDHASHSPPLFLSGHQSQLFHPGVWFKNFVLSRLATQHGGIAVNLMVDNDVVKSTAIAVPGGSLNEPQVAQIAYDTNDEPLPAEERAIRDPAMFASFGDRAAAHIGPLISDPLIKEFWPSVVRQSRSCDNLSECLGRARHSLEGSWGLDTVEVPLSRVCEFAAYRTFVAELLVDLPRFVEIHNAALAAYRKLHRLRNAAHPVPDLSRHDDWLEAPFWIWSGSDPRRRKLFARRGPGGVVEVTDLGGWRQTLSADLETSLGDISARGIKLRTRALTTTLFARLVLCDLFVHGIGGAKYDEVTDVLIARYYGLQPPDFMVATATLKLPFSRAAGRTPPDSQFAELLWQLRHQPERSFSEWPQSSQESEVARRWLDEKKRWIATPPTPANARSRCRAIRTANSELQPFLGELRDTLLRQREESKAFARQNELLDSREYAFCLHPEESLREFLSGGADSKPRRT